MRHTRIETANALGNSIIDVINEYARTHGAHDPLLYKVLLAALGPVVEEIDDKVYPGFSRMLIDHLGYNIDDD